MKRGMVRANAWLGCCSQSGETKRGFFGLAGLPKLLRSENEDSAVQFWETERKRCYAVWEVILPRTDGEIIMDWFEIHTALRNAKPTCGFSQPRDRTPSSESLHFDQA